MPAQIIPLAPKADALRARHTRLLTDEVARLAIEVERLRGEMRNLRAAMIDLAFRRKPDADA